MRAVVRYFNIVFIVAVLVVAGLAATGLLQFPASESGPGTQAGTRVTTGEVALSPAPDFLTPVRPEPYNRLAIAESDTGVIYRLIDQQTDLRGGTPVRYVRTVVDVGTRQAAEALATRLIDF